MGLRVMKPYVYQHYPLWVTLADGSQVIAQNADHEARILGGQKPAHFEGDPKDTVRAHAESLGIAVDGRWSVARIQREIAEQSAETNQETDK